MRIWDLTHTIGEGMPVYPGTEGPKLTAANTYEKDGFRETLLHMFSHTGTHMDAPAHLFEEGTSLDCLPVEQFAGSALVIDCTDLQAGERVPLSRIEQYGQAAEDAEFLLFRFGWDRFWGSSEYFGDYPCISADVAEYMIRTGKKGIGVDTIGIDPISESALPLHRKLLSGRDFVIIENLKDLSAPAANMFWLVALPLKYENADGAPIRAVAVIP